MARQSESPRFLLILGGLFLIAYAAYQVGFAWIEANPPATSLTVLTQPYPEPESTSTPLESYPGVVVMETPAQPYPGVEVTVVNVQPYPAAEITNTPEQSYPGLEIDNTPILAPTNTEAAPTPTLPIATPTPDELPTATSDDGVYPEPEQTSTPPTSDPNNPYPDPELTPTTDPNNPYPGPELTPTTDPNNPYPGPEQTPTTSPGDPYPGPEQSLTPTPSLTLELSTPTVMPTQEVVPTFVNTPTPFATLAFTETLIVSDGLVNQAVWLDVGTDLALATSNGVILQPSVEDEQRVLDKDNPIVSVAYIPGNDWIAAGGRDSLIRFWDVETGSFVKRFSGHLLGVVRLFYSPVRSFLASASDDATVRIWDINGGLLHTLRGPINRVLDMTVSLNGQMVASVSNQFVHVWNPQTGELIHTISQPEGWYTALAFNPNSQILTTAYDGRRIEFWDTTTWERTNFIQVKAPVQSLAYHPFGRLFAIGYSDGRIQIWDSRNGFPLANLSGHQGLTSMAFSPYEDDLITTSADGSIRIWDLAPLGSP